MFRRGMLGDRAPPINLPCTPNLGNLGCQINLLTWSWGLSHNTYFKHRFIEYVIDCHFVFMIADKYPWNYKPTWARDTTISTLGIVRVNPPCTWNCILFLPLFDSHSNMKNFSWLIFIDGCTKPGQMNYILVENIRLQLSVQKLICR